MQVASKKIRSSKTNPCPVCGRFKDSDCSWGGGVYLCHTFVDVNPDIPGYEYRKASSCGTWGIFVKNEPKAEREVKAIRDPGETAYYYYSPNNIPLVKVTRKDRGDGSKSFYQSRFENGVWIPGLTPEIRSQIRLYKILHPTNQKAIASGNPTLIVEGEGKVDALLDLGISATCSIGGAGKWRGYGYPNYLEDLKGATIVLCPDRDIKGLQHCEDIEKDYPNAAWLYAFPTSPEWLNLPKNGGLDLKDWILQGATAEEIIAAIRVKKYLMKLQIHPWRTSHQTIKSVPVNSNTSPM